MEASALASIYTMSYDGSFELFGKTINISAALHCGAAGAGAVFDFEEGKFKIISPSYGIIPEFGIDID